MADVARRSANRSKTIRDLRWHAAATWCFLLSLIVFFVISGSVIVRATFCIAFGLVLFFLMFRGGRSSPQAAYLKYFREQLGGDGPFLCEIEITPAGITATQNGVEMKRGWPSVKDIIDTSDGLEFHWRTGGTLVVRDRAFKTPDLRTAFLHTAREYRAAVAPA